MEIEIIFKMEISITTSNYRSRIQLHDCHARLPSAQLLILPTPSGEEEAKLTFGRVAGIDPRSMLILF